MKFNNVGHKIFVAFLKNLYSPVQTEANINSVEVFIGVINNYLGGECVQGKEKGSEFLKYLKKLKGRWWINQPLPLIGYIIFKKRFFLIPHQSFQNCSNRMHQAEYVALTKLLFLFLMR